MKKRSIVFICVIMLVIILCTGCGKKHKYFIAVDDGTTYKLTLKQAEPLPKLTDWEIPNKEGWVFCGIYGETRTKMAGSSQYSISEYRLYDSALKPVQTMARVYDRLYFKWLPETLSLNEENLMKFFDLEYEASVTETIYNDNGIKIPGMIQVELTFSPKGKWNFSGPVQVSAEIELRYNIIPGISGSGDKVTKEVEFLLDEENDYTRTMKIDMIDPAYLTTYSYDISVEKLTSVEGEICFLDVSDAMLEAVIEMGLGE